MHALAADIMTHFVVFGMLCGSVHYLRCHVCFVLSQTLRKTQGSRPEPSSSSCKRCYTSEHKQHSVLASEGVAPADTGLQRSNCYRNICIYVCSGRAQKRCNLRCSCSIKHLNGVFYTFADPERRVPTFGHSAPLDECW